MLRKALVALGVAAVAASDADGENCGGSLSMEPRYCTGKDVNNANFCTASALKYEEIVPLRIRVTNNANYDDEDANTVYVPGVLQANKQIQIVFACEQNSCNTAKSDALVFNEDLPACITSANAAKCINYETSTNLKKIGGWKFDMGGCNDHRPAGSIGNFVGVDHAVCSQAGSDKKCGCLTMGPTDVNIDPEEAMEFGSILMNTYASEGAQYTDIETFIVHVSAEEGFLLTRGGICSPNELTASGAGTAQANWEVYSPPPPSPPPPPPPLTPSPPPSPPPPPPRHAACVCIGGTIADGKYCASYGKCHFCEEALPEGACWYQGPTKPCVDSCEEIEDTERYMFAKRWGACSSMCPVSASKDPHLHLPHGGRADFRGKEDTVFNLLSAKDVAFNVLFEKGDFAWATRLVHGTKMAAGYWVITTSSGKTLNVEYAAEKFDPVAVVHEDEHRDVRVRQGTPALVVDDVIVSMVGKTLTVRTSKWLFTATTSAYPFGKLEMNKNKVLLDVAVQPLYNPDADPVAPHGILGQAYDQDNLAVDGKLDEEKTGESTTAAQAEGAIEGTWEDYMVSSKFSTSFKYSRFGLAKAAPRDVSKLTGTKKAMEDSAVGASDQQ